MTLLPQRSAMFRLTFGFTAIFFLSFKIVTSDALPAQVSKDLRDSADSRHIILDGSRRVRSISNGTIDHHHGHRPDQQRESRSVDAIDEQDCNKKENEKRDGSGYSSQEKVTPRLDGAASKILVSLPLREEENDYDRGEASYESRSRRSSDDFDTVDDSQESLELLKQTILPEHWDDPDQGFLIKRVVRSYKYVDDDDNDDKDDDDASALILEGTIPTVKPKGVKPTYDQIYNQPAFISVADMGLATWWALGPPKKS